MIDNVRYNLLGLLRGDVGLAGHTFPNAAPSCRELILVAHSDNGVRIVYLGNGLVSSTDFGVDLPAGQSVTFRADWNDVGLAEKWLLASPLGGGKIGGGGGARVAVQGEYA